MKNKMAIILLISALLLFSCIIFIHQSLKAKENPSMNNTINDSFQEEFAIYQINSDAFDSLLENDSFENIENFSLKRYSYPEDGENYITYNVTPFNITSDFVNFITNKSILEEYLSIDNTNETINHVVVFEAPYAPVSIWIKTDRSTYFLTVNDDEFQFTYSAYSQSDYIKKYKSQFYTLKINNENSNNRLIKTYYKHTELPLLEILTFYDSTIEWKNKTQVNISINNQTFVLDVKNNLLYKKHDKKNNILTGCNGGGPYNMYFSDGEYYVDSDTLQYIMLELGQRINIEYNTEQKIVNIITK